MPPTPAFAPGRCDRIFFRWIFPVLLVGIFAIYASYRQRYIGATDWYGYYQEAELLKTGHVYLPTELPPAEYPALVPFGYFVAHNHAVPQYPPGFPLLLALGGLGGLTFFVTPLIGVVSCILMFLVIRDLTDRWVAFVFTLAWAFFPIVVFGSTTMMSDLVAATGLLGAYYAYRRGQLLLSAWVLGFSSCVRPTNAFFLIAFLPLLARDRRLVRYGLYLLGPGLLYGFYNYKIYSRPWSTGYGDVRLDLLPEVFWPHLGFYLGQTLRQCTLVIVALALWGLRPWSRQKLFYLLWFVGFLVFYSFWSSGGSGRWWWSRFLLPGFPAVFLLAALGFRRVREALTAGTPGRGWRQGCVVLLFAAVALLPAYEIYFGRNQNDLWKQDKGSEYFEVVQRVAAVAPANSFVGSIEFAGSFRLYSSLTPFVSAYDNAFILINEAFRQQRSVYLVVEPWNHEHKAIRELLSRFSAEKIEDLPVWTSLGTMPLYRLRPNSPAPAAPGP